MALFPDILGDLMSPNSRVSLLVTCLPMLTAYVRRLAGNQQIAADLLQESIVRILATPEPCVAQDFLAWCCGVARHVMASDWRTRKRALSQQPLEGDLVDEISSQDGDPDGRVDARAFLLRASHAIDEEGLRLLVRRYVLEETGSELAEDLGQSSAALRMRLMRLRTTLSENGARPVVVGWRPRG
jgi:RNA polymerase sigma factor (sigma-70 family)